MDNNGNNQNNERPQDLDVSMQKSSELLKNVMNKTNRKIKSATSMKSKSGKNKVGKGAKLKALKKKAEGSKKIALGSAKAAAGGAAIGAGAVTSGIGLGLKAAAVAANVIPIAGQAISAALNTAATPVVEAGKQAMKTGADLAKSGAKSIASGTKDMHAAEQIEKGGKDPGGSSGGEGGNPGIPGIPKPGIPNKLKIIKDLMLKLVKKQAFKVGLVILLFALILIIIVNISHTGQVNNGKYKEGDNSNVPYVIDSQVMSTLTITTDGSGGFMYAFTDSEGNIIDLDTALDNALKTLKDNKCTAFSEMGNNDKERKELLKKLVQAEIATQYPDLSISRGSSGTSSSSSNAVNGIDFCVDTSNTNSLPVLNEEQLTQIVNNSDATQQGKENMLSVVPDLVRYQEQYNVNAVFFMAVAFAESGWGVGWDLIDPSTYNWISIKGSHGGGYIDYNGTSWNVYTSYSDAAEYFFDLISDPDFVYFGAQKYTIYDIAPTYCDIGWGDTTSKFIQNAYASIGITPNSADNPTASGGQGTNSLSSGSSSNNTDASGNNTATSDQIGWLWTISFENFNAYLYHHNSSRVNYTDLYVEGYITEDRKNYIVTSTDGYRYAGPGVQLESNKDIFAEFGVDVESLNAGSLIDCDIVEQVSLKAYNNLLEKVKSDASSQGCTLNENQAQAVADAYYLNGPYSDAANFGSLYTQYGDTDDLANNYIGFSLVDSAGSAGTRSECAWALFHFGVYHSRDPNFNEMVENGEIEGISPGAANIPGGGSKGDIQGRIKIQRKDENGNTRTLTYTDPTTFKSMISSKNSNVMNYYTLQPASGSKASSGINGVKLQGSDVAEQVWNFLVNDMGYSEYVAAGVMGNIENESSFIPDADNGTHYGLCQWSKEYCPEVNGADLATQLEFFSEWIGSGQFDDYADNYKSGFSYDEFLKLTDPGQAAIAFATVMERFGTPYSSGGASNSEYAERAEDANNYYVTYAGTTSSSTSSNNSSSSNNNSSSNGTSSSSSASSGNGSSGNGNSSFLQTAIDCHAYLRENGYQYSQGRAMPVVKGESEKRIDCSAYVSWCLYEYGLYDGEWQLTAGDSMANFGKANLETVFEGSANSVSELPELQPGDIILESGHHTQIFYGFNGNGDAIWLNCGGEASIGIVEGEDTTSGILHPVTHVFRVPGEGKAIVDSLDNFLFIGDSRYSTTATQIAALGNNIKNEGVVSARIDEWLAVANNGGTGTVQSTDVDITGTYSGISVQLGANSVYDNVDTAVSQMEEFLNKLKELHPGTPIFVNSCLSVNANANSSGYSWDVTKMKDCIKEFDNNISDFCNQNSDLYFVDISSGLEDENGFVKSEYESDGLHCNSTSAGIFAQNIKDSILSAGAAIGSSDNSTSGSAGGYSLVVANKKVVTTTVVDNYSYTGETYSIEKNNGIRHNGLSQATQTPSSKTISTSTTTTYTTTTVDYQSALKNYTLYFDFLWAILVNSAGDRDFVSSWADLAINGNVNITVYSDANNSSKSSSIDKGTYSHTILDTSSSLAIYDVYSISEVTTVTTKTIDSKLAITDADTWFIKYVNNADTYSEFKGKSKERVIEKTDPDADEDNIVKILRKNKSRLSQLIREEDTVDEMLEENEKVNFMIDIYSYVLQVADGKSPDEIKLSLDGLLDTSVFDLSNTEEIKVNSVLLYDSLNINDTTLQLLYKAVEKVCEPYGDNDENTKRKKYVTSVILNRAMSSKFPDSVEKVLKQTYQFENYNPNVLKEDITISESTKEAVDTIVVAGDCAKHSVYFAKPSTAEKNTWDEQYTFTFNDGDETDNSFNYYTTDEVDAELKQYETTIRGKMTRPSIKGRKIIEWAKEQVGKSVFTNRHENKKMNSNDSSPEFIKSAYYEGELEYISGDIPSPNEIEHNDDGTVDYSKIPETAVIVADNGIASLYIGNGYVIEAGGSKIQKVPIDQSQGAGHFIGWGFAANDQEDAREQLVVAVGSGNYAQGWTPLEDASSTGIDGVFSVGDKEYKIFLQTSGPWSSRPYWESVFSCEACGPTSIAIIASGYGNDITPDDTATQCELFMGWTPRTVRPGDKSLGDWNNKAQVLNHYGIKTSEFSGGVINYDRIKNNLKEGRPVMLSVKGFYGPRETGGHFITLLGYDELQNKAFIGDPVGGASGWWDFDVIYSSIQAACYIES